MHRGSHVETCQLSTLMYESSHLLRVYYARVLVSSLHRAEKGAVPLSSYTILAEAEGETTADRDSYI